MPPRGGLPLLTIYDRHSVSPPSKLHTSHFLLSASRFVDRSPEEMNAGRQRTYGSDGRKERDDDLFLFRELFKREEQRNVSLLQPDDFETANGNNQLYKIPSVKKGAGYDFLGIDGEKNDYDWLMTPPATPLFPSLEVEPNDLVLHKEIPILHPIKTSRFASKLESPKPGYRPKSPSSRSVTSSQSDSSSSRSETPNRRPNSSSGNSTTTAAATLTLKEALNLKQRPNRSTSTHTKNSKPTPATTPNAAAAAAARSSSATSTATTPKKQNPDKKLLSRGVSPFVRSRIPSTLPGFSDETPPNLITSAATGRALSASRCRPVNPAVESKVEAGKPRRQSCSPSVARGRTAAEIGRSDGGRVPAAAASGNLVVGSRMVEKLMNARRSDGGGEEKRDLKPKQRVASANDGAGFGRLMSRASLDAAIKHMEIRKGPSDHQQNIVRVKGSTLTRGGRSTSDDTRNLWGRGSTERRSLIEKGN